MHQNPTQIFSRKMEASGVIRVQQPCHILGIALLFILLISITSAEMSVDSHRLRPGSTAIFTINVTNTGETALNPINVIDTLPKGMDYITDDHNPRGKSIGNKIIWPNVGPLNFSESEQIHLLTKIDNSAVGKLTNRVSVIGTPVPEGYNVTSSDEEYVDVKETKIIRDVERINIGNQAAMANGNGRATNNIKIVSG